ncbi:MAG: FmdB family zinc ribbon protein [Acidobacteriota bacterium]
MPLYEYRCEGCGKTVEVIQKFSDVPLSLCAQCGGRLERLLSAPAIQFKGSGWYVTDYGNRRAGNSGNGSSPKSDQAASKSDSKGGAGKDSTATSSPD